MPTQRRPPVSAFLLALGGLLLIPTVAVFIVAFMRLEAREKWRTALIMAAVMCALIYAVFDRLHGLAGPTLALLRH